MRRRSPRSTRTYTLVPYTTVVRSKVAGGPDPAERVEAVEAVQGLVDLVGGDEAFIYRGGDHGRGDRVDPDVVRGQMVICAPFCSDPPARSEEHTSELQSLMRISYAVLRLQKTKRSTHQHN